MEPRPRWPHYRGRECVRTRPARSRNRRAPADAPVALHQSGAVLARLRRARPARGAGRAEPAPRAGEVPDDLREHARRVLPGPGRRPAPAGRRRLATTVARTAGPRPSSSRAIRTRVRELIAEHAAIFARLRDGARRGRASRSSTTARCPTHHAAPPRALRRRDLPGPHAARGGSRAIRSRTSARSACSIAVGVRDPETGERRFARVKVPPILPRFVEIEPRRFVPASTRSSRPTSTCCSAGMEILETHLFRVTRNADLAIEEDEADDLLLAIEEELRRRRFGEAVRLEVERSMPAATRQHPAARHRPRARTTATRSTGMLDLTGLCAARGPRSAGPRSADLDAGRARRGSCRPTRTSRSTCSRRSAPATSSSTTRTRASPRRVERFIAQAADDPEVLTIKMTLYRTSRRLADRARPDPGGRAGQAGRGPRRDQGPLRRGGEHRLGAQARAGRRPRRLRPRRPQDALARSRSSSAARAPACAATSTSGPATTTRKTARLYVDLGPAVAAGRSSAPTSPTCSTS